MKVSRCRQPRAVDEAEGPVSGGPQPESPAVWRQNATRGRLGVGGISRHGAYAFKSVLALVLQRQSSTKPCQRRGIGNFDGQVRPSLPRHVGLVSCTAT